MASIVLTESQKKAQERATKDAKGIRHALSISKNYDGGATLGIELSGIDYQYHAVTLSADDLKKLQDAIYEVRVQIEASKAKASAW